MIHAAVSEQGPNSTGASSPVRRLALLCVLSAGALLFAPSVAQGAAIAENCPVIGQSCAVTYTAAAGETNSLTFTYAQGTAIGVDTYSITDSTATTNPTTVAGGKCTVTDPIPAPVTISCSDDLLTLGTASYSFSLGDGNDSFTGATVPGTTDQVALLDGGTGNDTLTGTQSNNNITGGDGTDTINGSAGGDTLSGDAGNDTLNGGAGVDTESGGADNDTFNQDTAANGGDTLNGGAGTDEVGYNSRTTAVTVTIDGTANDGQSGENDNVQTDVENVDGGSGNDTINGATAVSNVLDGGGGNDTMNGELAAATTSTVSDTFIGGGGTDTVTYAPRTTSVSALLDTAANDGQSGENDNIGPSDDVENITGGAAADALQGNSQVNVLLGGDGADNLGGRLGGDTLTGGAGSPDTVTYNGRTNPIIADLDGEAADDGEVGEGDTISADTENLTGGSGSDQLTGNAGVNTLNGGADAGMDRLTGLAGADVLIGGAGIDRAIYTASPSATNITIDNTANDTDGTGATTENVQDTVESISGSNSAADVLTGSCFANTLAGQAGADTLNGDPAGCAVGGGDFLGGGAGNDILRGLTGTDSATYTTNTAAQGINVTLDGVANDNDGVGGTDNIASDIETVYGGAGPDRIDATGAGSGASLLGLAGNDTLIGSPFNDAVRGQQGADSMNCAGGTNDIYDVDPADTSVTNCETPG